MQVARPTQLKHSPATQTDASSKEVRYYYKPKLVDSARYQVQQTDYAEDGKSKYVQDRHGIRSEF